MAPFTTNTQDAEHTITKLLENIGEDPKREGLIDTPMRVVRSWHKLYGGYAWKAENVLGTTFQEKGEYDGMIFLKDIVFYSTCEHHMLPFFGKVHIAYIPNGRVVGISKLARLVEIHSRRLQIQERMTSDIAGDIDRILQPEGVAVLVEAQHFCIRARGVEKQEALMITSKFIGTFHYNMDHKQEFISMIK